MKYLLLALLLAGCNWYSGHTPDVPVETLPPTPVMIANGTSGAIDWSCRLTEFNQTLAWVQCKFANISAKPADQVCIRVTFFDEETGKIVADSQTICSGFLLQSGASTNYVVFQKEKRASLRKCGEKLALCVMLAGTYQ